ncbi:MAG: hypothetical protein U0359_01355 [Byssovorax sp.]
MGSAHRSTPRRGGSAAAIVSFAQGLLALCLATTARADDAAEARALFDEAVRLRTAGDIGAACARFEESDRKVASLTTERELADCYARAGKTATAWTLFNTLSAKLTSAGQAQEGRAARARAAELEPHLSRLRVIVTPPDDDMPGLRVVLDELVVGRNAYGIALPVDPGPHKVKAGAARRLPWEKKVEVPADGALVDVKIPRLDLDPSQDEEGDYPPDRVAVVSPRPAVGPAVDPIEAPGPEVPGATSKLDGPIASAKPDRRPAPPRPLRRVRPKLQRNAALGLGGAGLGGLLVGAITGGLALARGAQWRSYSAAHCNGAGACDKQSSIDILRHIEHDRAAFAATANIGLVGGTAALGGAVLLWLTPVYVPIGPAAKPRVASSWWVAPQVGQGEAGASLGGQF